MTPDLDGVQTLTKFGFSSRNGNNDKSPDLRGITPNRKFNSKDSEAKMSPHCQKFQNKNYYVRNNS